LNPLSTLNYCISTEPLRASPSFVLIPLIFNNTVPSRLIYSITTFDPSKIDYYEVPAVDLIPASRSVVKEFDIDDWATIVDSPSPSLSILSNSNSKRPSLPPQNIFSLSPAQSFYYLRVDQIGEVQLGSVYDSSNRLISIIRRKKSPTALVSSSVSDNTTANRTLSRWEGTNVLACPSVQFSTSDSNPSTRHICHNPLVPSLIQLNMVTTGTEPLKIQWHSIETKYRKKRRMEQVTLEILREDSNNGEISISLNDPGRYEYFIDSIEDGVGNIVSNSPIGQNQLHDNRSSSASATSSMLFRSVEVVLHRLPEIALSGGCAEGRDIPLRQNGRSSTMLEMKITNLDMNSPSLPSTFVEISFVPEVKGGLGWKKEIKIANGNDKLALDVDAAGTYEVISIRSEYCAGVVLFPNSVGLVFHLKPLTC
jgi:nucleoporin POM152